MVSEHNRNPQKRERLKDGWHKLWRDGFLYVETKNKKVIHAQIRKNGSVSNVGICYVHTDGRLFNALPSSLVTIKKNLLKGTYAVSDWKRNRIDLTDHDLTGKRSTAE